MKRFYIVTFFSLVIMLSNGCEKSNDDEVNININGTLYESVSLSDDGTGTFFLSLTTSSTTISGNIKGSSDPFLRQRILFL